ncbi:MAG: PD-(D/E)XK nuclease family protein, partial [Desulfovibrionaceae bacterium]|nr:PD-(D/E)XK nuclease family protein [Desulfovibrionaceae bacterium]
FLSALRDLVLDATGGQPGKAIVVFPNDRPKRYFKRLFSPAEPETIAPHDFPKRSLPAAKGSDRALILPKMMTVGELFALLGSRLAAPMREAGKLDQIAILWNAVQELRASGHEAASGVSRSRRALLCMTEEIFFPWGARLASLLEECLSAGITPENILYPDDVEPIAAELLKSLHDLFSIYRSELEKHQLTTPGLTAFRVLQSLESWEGMPEPLRGRVVFLAGFNALNTAEDKLFRKLWENGAHVCLYADPQIARQNADSPKSQGKKGFHYACGHIDAWLNEWKAAPRLFEDSQPPKQSVTFFAGNDLHSQLQALQDDLSGFSETKESMAVVLTHSRALLPVLHHLPSKDCNVSLGYPLEQAPFVRLISIITEIADSAKKDGLAYWKPVMELVSHPCLRMLSTSEGSLRPVLLHMERRLREGKKFVSPAEVAEWALQKSQSGPETCGLLRGLLDACIHTWSNVSTTKDMADCLWNLCELLLDKGREAWRQFPLDEEALLRFINNVIPALRTNLMAERPLPWTLLSSVLREQIEAERVPFEADPLTGLQVLGMLETRLLHLEHLFFIDLTEDKFPGVSTPNPLMPESLRLELNQPFELNQRLKLNLPSSSQRELVAAYTFYSLCAGAKTIHCYWQEGEENSGLFSGKKQKSRFVEELIWKEEQKRGKLLEKGVPPLRMPQPRLSRPKCARMVLPRTPAAEKALNAFLERPISLSALDAYLKCPARFYYERLCGLVPLAAVQEGDDAPGVGELFHNVLQEFYEPWLGRSVKRSDLSPEALAALFRKRLKESGLAQSLPPESAVLLDVAGPERLERFLSHQPEETRILSLESQLVSAIDLPGKRLTLRGRLDRVDQREGQTIILDYKTGKVPDIPPSFWESSLHERIREALEIPGSLREAAEEHDLLNDLAEELPSIQLPAYLYLLRKNSGQGDNAAYVELALNDEEKPLFTEKDPQELQSLAVEELMPNLVRVTAKALMERQVFMPREGAHCGFCPAAGFCLGTRKLQSSLIV